MKSWDADFFPASGEDVELVSPVMGISAAANTAAGGAVDSPMGISAAADAAADHDGAVGSTIGNDDGTDFDFNCLNRIRTDGGFMSPIASDASSLSFSEISGYSQFEDSMSFHRAESMSTYDLFSLGSVFFRV